MNNRDSLKGKKRTSVTVKRIVLTVVIACLCLNFCYVLLLGSIRSKNNRLVKALLWIPFPSLNVVSGPLPFGFVLSNDGWATTPLEMACTYGNYDAAKLLIERGAEAGSVREYDFSLLYLAMESTEKDDYKLIKMLVDNGADPNGKPENDDFSSLENCSRMDCGDYYYNNYLEVPGPWKEELYRRQHSKYDIEKAQMIKDIYAFLNSKIKEKNNYYEQESGTTPLHWAVNAQNLSLIDYLLKHTNYEINEQDSDGQTCLHFLICFEKAGTYDKKWKKDTLELLIKNGADLTIKDNEGKTAYDYAVEIKDDYFAGLLKSYMEN